MSFVSWFGNLCFLRKYYIHYSYAYRDGLPIRPATYNNRKKLADARA